MSEMSVGKNAVVKTEQVSCPHVILCIYCIQTWFDNLQQNSLKDKCCLDHQSIRNASQ